MAAPCRRMASRSLLQFLSCFTRTTVGNAGFRHLSGTSLCRATLRTQSVAERANSPWTLMAAVCLQRLPVVSAECNELELRFGNLMRQMEVEKSVLSDHELRVLEDADRTRLKQSDDYDSEDEDIVDDDIILGQDLEDQWEQKIKDFEPTPRVKADAENNLNSAERCLADTLVLLAEQQVGDGKLWLLPQAQWQEGETLRHTAERALASLPAAGFKATFLSNAPCGVYKYKLPKAIRTESSVGAKVFFFKAVLSGSVPPEALNSALMWLKKSELQHYLKPAYMTKVDPFILDL